MRKFADKLRNFSMTPSPDSQPTSGGPHRRHSFLSASAIQTPAASSTRESNTPTAHPSWAIPALAVSPEFAPQRLLSQFGGSPQVASTAKKAHGGHKQAQPAAGWLNKLACPLLLLLCLDHVQQHIRLPSTRTASLKLF